MALISCYECKEQVSEIAESCPKCGAPVVSEIKQHVAEVVSNNHLSSLLFFGPIIWLAVAAYLEGPDGFARDFRWARWIMAAGVAFYLLSEFVRNLKERKLRKANRPQ